MCTVGRVETVATKVRTSDHAGQSARSGGSVELGCGHCWYGYDVVQYRVDRLEFGGALMSSVIIVGPPVSTRQREVAYALACGCCR